MRVCTLLLGAAIMSPGPDAAVIAAEIYRWVDADGVVHYADAAPRDDVAVTTLEIDDARPSSYDPDEDHWSILNQAARMSAKRTALVQAREDRERAARENRAAAMPPAAPSWWQPSGPQYYFGSRVYYPPAVPPAWHVRPRPGTALRQFNAMEQLDLTGPRPQSINSGVHQQRVERSMALPITRPRPLPGPGAPGH